MQEPSPLGQTQAVGHREGYASALHSFRGRVAIWTLANCESDASGDVRSEASRLAARYGARWAPELVASRERLTPQERARLSHAWRSADEARDLFLEKSDSQALERLRPAVETILELDHPWLCAVIQQRLGLILTAVAKGAQKTASSEAFDASITEARAALEDAVRICDSLDEPWLRGITQKGIAEVHTALGYRGECYDTLVRVAEASRSIDDWSTLFSVLQSAGEFRRLNREYELADPLLSQAEQTLDAHPDCADGNDEFSLIQARLRVADALHDTASSERLLMRLDSFASRAPWSQNDPRLVAEHSYFSAMNAFAKGRFEDALRQLDRFDRAVEGLDPVRLGTTRGLLSRAIEGRTAILAKSGRLRDDAAAEALLHRACDRIDDLVRRGICEPGGNLVCLTLRGLGDYDLAETFAWRQVASCPAHLRPYDRAWWLTEQAISAFEGARVASDPVALERAGALIDEALQLLDDQLAWMLLDAQVREARVQFRDAHAIAIDIAAKRLEWETDPEARRAFGSALFRCAERASRDTLTRSMTFGALALPSEASPEDRAALKKLRRDLSVMEGDDALAAWNEIRAFQSKLHEKHGGGGVLVRAGDGPMETDPGDVLRVQEHLVYLVSSPLKVQVVHVAPGTLVSYHESASTDRDRDALLARARDVILNAADAVPSRECLQTLADASSTLLPAGLLAEIPAGVPVTIVAAGQLATFPLEALLTAIAASPAPADWKTLPYLIRRNVIRRAPSVAALRALRERSVTQKMSSSHRCVLVTAAELPADAHVPAVDEKATLRLAVKRALDFARILEGKAASKSNVSQLANAGVGLLAIMTHGWINESDARAGLFLSGSTLADAMWEAREIQQSGIPARIALIAACRSGEGSQFESETPYGVSYAFLDGGAGAVIAGICDLPEVETSRLVDRWLTHKTDCASVALQKAKCERIEEGGPPAAWAGLVLVGLDPIIEDVFGQ